MKMAQDPLVEEDQVEFHAEVEALQEILTRNLHCQRLDLRGLFWGRFFGILSLGNLMRDSDGVSAPGFQLDERYQHTFTFYKPGRGRDGL